MSHLYTALSKTIGCLIGFLVVYLALLFLTAQVNIGDTRAIDVLSQRRPILNNFDFFEITNNNSKIIFGNCFIQEIFPEGRSALKEFDFLAFDGQNMIHTDALLNSQEVERYKDFIWLVSPFDFIAPTSFGTNFLIENAKNQNRRIFNTILFDFNFNSLNYFLIKLFLGDDFFRITKKNSISYYKRSESIKSDISQIAFSQTSIRQVADNNYQKNFYHYQRIIKLLKKKKFSVTVVFVDLPTKTMQKYPFLELIANKTKSEANKYFKTISTGTYFPRSIIDDQNIYNKEGEMRMSVREEYYPYVANAILDISSTKDHLNQ